MRLLDCKGVLIAIKDAEGCTLSTYLSLEQLCCFRAFEFLHAKSDARALHEALSFQLQLDGCKGEVMIAANVGTRERSCLCFVNVGLAALGCQDEVYLVVNLPIMGMPGYCSGQLVGMESVAKSESVVL